MKNKKSAVFLTALLVGLVSTASYACTGIRLVASDGGAVVGRTMEFGFDVQSDVVVVPAGTQLANSLADQSQGMHYTSKYGMVGANALGKNIIVDGVNERGFMSAASIFRDMPVMQSLMQKRHHNLWRQKTTALVTGQLCQR